jgi:hypothetical protein
VLGRFLHGRVPPPVALGPPLNLCAAPSAGVLSGWRRERRVLVGHLASSLRRDVEVATDLDEVPELPRHSARTQALRIALSYGPSLAKFPAGGGGIVAELASLLSVRTVS